MSKVGIVIINFNSMKYLPLTMESLVSVKGSIPFSIGVIDNGSSKDERDACEKLVKDYAEKYPEREIEFFDAGKNLGFSGGNNVVIKAFMEREDITHICLLNSDVIVTDFWLDYMMEKDCDVIGPVTNAAGNEQTIQIDYSAEPNEEALTLANTYAKKRHESYKGYVTDSELVTFFATIIKREVIEKIGLLDEQFYPGSYEDDDYCVRILEAGYGINIARDCFLHHFGSGSFSNLKMNERQNIGNINRERFEKKWNRPWKDRTWKLLESCKQDMDYLLRENRQEWQKEQLDTSMVQIEKLMEDWGEAIKFFTSRADQVDVNACEYSGKQLLSMLSVKAKRKIKNKLGIAKREVNRKVNHRDNDKKIKEGLEKTYALIKNAGEKGHKPICVFAPMYNKENERDGYIQRIKAVDLTVLKDMCRIYLYDEGVECTCMRFDFIDELHGYIVFNSHDPRDLEEIKKLVSFCKVTYTHSLLRFMEDRTDRALWSVFDDINVKHFWDVHGTVPEEYAMSGSELGSKMADEVEEFLANRVDCIVVVTEAMGRYLKKKHPKMRAEIKVVPILNKDLLKKAEGLKKNDNGRYTIVYAGGTQPWQNIGLMQDIISKTDSLYDFKMFVPNPDEFRTLWGDRKEATGMTVDSKSPEDLYEEYKSCDFGFVLRDSDPVNYVACPTKIIEYLRFGIIPILKTTEIGDFVDMGMQYIPYTDVLNGIKMTEEKHREILENNYGILDKLTQVYVKGIEELSASVCEGKKPIVIKPNEGKPAIGLVVTTFEKGGLEQVVLNLYNGYKKDGYPVYLLCQKNILGPMAEQIEDGELLVFEDSMKLFLYYLQEKHITVLHYHYNTFGCIEAKALGVHTLYTMHNVYTWKSDSEITDYSHLLDTMDEVIPVSNLVKKYYLARTEAREDNLKVIYNGIDFGELGEKNLPDTLSRKALGIGEDDIVLGFVASFYPVKYQIGMIGVMEELMNRYPNVKLLFIGNCENDYHRLFMEELNKSSAKDTMIHVPYFAHCYMGEFLRRIVDIFTLPTLQEGCSNAVLEAIFCDKPMVLTDVGNARDVEYLKSCEVVDAAYDDITKTSNDQIMKISSRKNSANKDKLVEAFSKVIDNIDEYKKAAAISDEEKKQYETSYMVGQYIDVIKNISESE
ncbi:MAG: glycosyltransferase [Lachnospiraceae bacterium]|nr:glycosyltransferase [Lachnospiraceae bacterium]